MNDQTQAEIQQWVVELLATLADDRQDAARDQCSEMTRLVACWILAKHPTYRAVIAKGEFFDSSAHDILVVQTPERLIAIDPTVWQFYPESSSIFVGVADTMSDLLDLLVDKYGGSWDESEELAAGNEAYERALLEVIERNR
jgi:hypothetical protein